MEDNNDVVDSIMADVIGGVAARDRLGDDPTRDEMEAEVAALKAEGFDGMAIGKRLGVPLTTAGNEAALDLLEEVLTDEFEDYGN